MFKHTTGWIHVWPRGEEEEERVRMKTSKQLLNPLWHQKVGNSTRSVNKFRKISLFWTTFFCSGAKQINVINGTRPSGLTWICRRERSSIFCVERGLILRSKMETSHQNTGIPWIEQLEGLQRGQRRSPWSSWGRCLELRCWPLQRRGPSPNHWTSTPPVWEASLGRPWWGKTPFRIVAAWQCFNVDTPETFGCVRKNVIHDGRGTSWDFSLATRNHELSERITFYIHCDAIY